MALKGVEGTGIVEAASYLGRGLPNFDRGRVVLKTRVIEGVSLIWNAVSFFISAFNRFIL